jgi:four helix bundle protein
MLRLAHKDLQAYKLSLQLIKKIYKLTESFPKHEQYALVQQIRRAVISVSSNIAEGSSRYSKAEKKRYYEIARSSLVEIDTQIEASLILNYLTHDQLSDVEVDVESVFRMLSKMIRNLMG